MMPVQTDSGVAIVEPDASCELSEPPKRDHRHRARRSTLSPAERAARQAAAAERRRDALRKREVRAAERAERNGGAPLQMLVGVEWDGLRYQLQRPEELAWLTEAHARRLVSDVLLLAALGGNVNAARAWLDQYRWMRETKNGTRARGGGSQVNVGVQLVIEDDLREGAKTVAMERVKPGQPGSLKGRRVNPPPLPAVAEHR